MLALIPPPFSNKIGPVHIYSLTMLLAIFTARFLILHFAKKYNKTEIIDFVKQNELYVIVSSIIGARVYHLFTGYDWDNGVFGTIEIWQGGISIWGALIGGIASTWWLSRSDKLDFSIIFDLSVVGVVAGHAIGRWGNYFNQELYGKPLDSKWFWALKVYDNTYHPTFLYEFLGCSIILILLIVLLKKNIVGLTTSVYLMTYGLLRAGMELLRIDHSTYVGPLRFNFFVAMVMFIIGFLLFIKAIKRSESWHTKQST